MRYAILDLETTGGSAKVEKITEVAIILYEDGQVLEEYESLVNPERGVPPFVARMTGLTNEVLATAPKFYEIARKIVEITEGATIVAHNARFDYAFLQNEFKRLGFSFSRKRLCTLELSRRLLPTLPKYGLDALTKHFGIVVHNRHRAMGDTRATLQLFEYLIDIQKGNDPKVPIHKMGIDSSKIPRSMNREQIESLPDSCGVYFFEDQDGDYLYIGKSIHIKKRIFQHLNEVNRKSQIMHRQTAHIDYQLTGSELASLLIESHLIKKYRPPLNKAQRNNRYPYALVQYEKDGYICFGLTKRPRPEDVVLDQISKPKRAKEYMAQVISNYELCHILCGLEKNKKGKPCQDHLAGRCPGACIGNENPRDYNQRAQLAAEEFDNSFEEDFLLMDYGRNEEEKSVYLISGGHYRGMTYVDTTEGWPIQDLMDQIDHVTPNREYNSIVRRFISMGGGLEKITLAPQQSEFF